MSFGIELVWTRCPDGAKLVEHAGGEALLSSETGLFICYRTDAERVYERTQADVRDTMLEEFINCSTENKLVSFVSKHGHPARLAEGAMGTSLHDIETKRDHFRRILGLHQSGSSDEAAIELDAYGVTIPGRALKPSFRITDDGRRQIVFSVGDPYGFMYLEASMILTEAASLLVCHHCGTAFLAGGSTGRSLRSVYCANKCRVAASRLKKPTLSAG